MKFVVYHFKTTTGNTWYYTDQRIPYQEWIEMIENIQNEPIISTSEILTHFTETLSKCGIKQIHPICEEYCTFGSENQ